jgi:hypothetical protein
MVELLTYNQQEHFDDFMEAIENKQDRICYTDCDVWDRGWGKTIVINELGLHLQTMGYIVCLLSPITCIDYCVSKIIRKAEDLRGKQIDKLVVLIDEEMINSKLFLSVENFCDIYRISMVGFVRY